MEFLKKTFLCLCFSYLLTFVITEKVYTDEFAVHIRGGRSVADELAVKYGYVNKGQIGELQDHYLFQHSRIQRRSVLPSEGEHTFLENEAMVEWMEQQHIKKRVKRDFLEVEKRGTIQRVEALQQGLKSRASKKLDKVIKDPKALNDPSFKDQWYMDRSGSPTMNVEGAWDLGYTGLGVVVSILDDGIELNHPDLKLNFDQQASYDYNNNRKNPSPRYDYANTNRHGTRCAGEVAMQADNGICGVGIAYNASIGGVRMLDGDVTDSVEASSLSHARRHIDIYSASWGPDDDGRTVDGPGRLAKQAFKEGITQGRHGLGSIYVWASGNGGRSGDSCSCDGYTNSIYTLSISSTSENGASPWYLETCASTLATTYSSGDRKERQIVTTDIHQSCTKEHTGTSASAPIAAGIIALVLQANPTLTWRDVQYLVVRTSRRENLKAKDWTLNGAGYEVSHLYGFGLMDAKAMVEAAKTWKTLPEQRVCKINVIESPRTLDGSTTRLTINTTACEGTSDQVGYLEHVQAKITLDYSQRGALKLRLTSPRQTESTILQPRRGDQRSGRFSEWPFMSTHYWGEETSGTWILEVENTGLPSNSGHITQWTLILYGTENAPAVSGSRKPRSNDQDEDSDSWDTSDWTWESSYSSYSYDDDNCHEECWDTGCDGPNADDCFKCKHFRDRITQNCVKYCPDGQYPPTYMHERCKTCNKECKTCVGPEPWDCTSCSDDLFLLDGECLEECDNGFFADKGDNVCHRCDDLCEECKDVPDNCQSCVAGAVLDGNECKLSCPSNYYLKDSQCLSCHTTCESCHGPDETDCISCDIDLVHKGNRCVDDEQCGDGFYISTDIHGGEVSRECIACHPTCKTCDGFAFDDCLSCMVDSYLNFGVCEPDCRDGTYRDVDDDKCHACPDGCKLCITELICIACEDDRVLNDGSCDEGCSSGSYDSEGECFQCHSLCEECNDGGLTDCTECKQDEGKRYLLEGACLPFCPEGYFMDDDSYTCMECDETCRRCNAKECIECIDQNVTPDPLNWVCGEDEHGVPCGNTCETCMSDAPDQCFSCKSNYYMFNYDCKDTCPPGYFGDDTRQSCRLCHPMCKECTGLHVHECTSCDPEYVLAPVGHKENNKKTCETHCPDGTYEENSIVVDGRQCLPCHDSCSTCDGALEVHCVSCSTGIFLEVNWSTSKDMPERRCVENCEDGTFGAPDDGECLPCHPSCQTCISDPNHCTACSQGYVEDENDHTKCVNAQGCRDDQFTNGNNCENCHYTCETCNGPEINNCLSCDYYRFLTTPDENEPAEKQCEEVCPAGTYPDFDLNICLNCHESCDGCVMGGPSDCLDCKEGLYSYPYEGQACVESCPEGFYELEESGYKTCQQCSIECKDCDQSYWQCISCNDNTYLFQDRCVNACPYGFTEDDHSNHCVNDDDERFPCPLNCQECDDWGDCHTCDDGYNPYYGECIEQEDIPCEDGQYPTIDEKDETVCELCHTDCATCQGPGNNECLSCPSQHKLSHGTCVSDCPEGMYHYIDTDKCLGK
ncbi:proprotein convertase subtilisin/kexin type 6-like [Amphiura filiformis]|uniref:proprotein convertase subtilisin/kexin type 6-like n=1 Tax=Amphiura filiformis TaxID=82378 RepID=UPI003B211A86